MRERSTRGQQRGAHQLGIASHEDVTVGDRRVRQVTPPRLFNWTRVSVRSIAPGVFAVGLGRERRKDELALVVEHDFAIRVANRVNGGPTRSRNC